MSNKKTTICLIGLLVSLVILFGVFFATDGLLGDKEFSDYTQEDWSIAVLPLSVMAVALLSALVFSLILIIPYFSTYPALADYISYKKFSGIDSSTEFLVFDHNELKRACCRSDGRNGLWISVKEYVLKTRSWTVLEEGRHIENADELTSILQEQYKYDKIKAYEVPSNLRW